MKRVFERLARWLRWLRSTTPTVVIHLNDASEMSFKVIGRVKVFFVDETAPYDRVYEITHRSTAEEVATLLGADVVGHEGDSRHAAIAARLQAEAEGKPHLTVIE